MTKTGRIAIIGAGIAGISCAWLLARHAGGVHQCDAARTERDTLGGHTNTVDVTVDGIDYPVDTGFLVFNDWTYPNLISMFKHLGVEVAPSGICRLASNCWMRLAAGKLEWCGSHNLSTVFAQPVELAQTSVLGNAQGHAALQSRSDRAWQRAGNPRNPTMVKYLQGK